MKILVTKWDQDKARRARKPTARQRLHREIAELIERGLWAVPVEDLGPSEDFAEGDNVILQDVSRTDAGEVRVTLAVIKRVQVGLDELNIPRPVRRRVRDLMSELRRLETAKGWGDKRPARRLDGCPTSSASSPSL